ncbi:MAG: type VI secretion system baseplate subunit TssF [Nitrospinota bacterium]
MDPRLLSYYNQELHYIREMGGEFAKEFPKIAGRLGLDSFECSDPYVERLLEGFSFLAARVQLKLDSEFPRFTQNLLEMLYPHYLAPTPSMAVVSLEPDLKQGSFDEGLLIPKNTVLKSNSAGSDLPECEYRTVHDITFWPIEISLAQYISNLDTLPKLNYQSPKNIKAALRLRFRATSGLTFDKLKINTLSLYLRGQNEIPMLMYEQMVANSVCVAVCPGNAKQGEGTVLNKSHISRLGLSKSEALIPYSGRSFQGHRLLHEYFSFPERFMFLELSGLEQAVTRSKGTELDIYLLLDQHSPFLETRVDPSNFMLFCSPAVNLFPRKTDRVQINNRVNEFHIVPDRTRPLDYEVYSVNSVHGIGTSGAHQEFCPFYSTNDVSAERENPAYYTLRREPRLLSSKQRKYGSRSGYNGSELYISLVDPSEAPYKPDLRELALNVMCTNRDLPLLMPTGKGETDFKVVSGEPVAKVRCVAGPTNPRSALAEGKASWRLISHLSLNYLSLIDGDGKKNAKTLRELLSLYGDKSDPHIKKQINGVVSMLCSTVTRRIPVKGTVSFARGLEIEVTFDESAFEGTGAFLLSGILETFFDKYVSINTFTETIVKTVERGKIYTWPMRAGTRQTL